MQVKSANLLRVQHKGGKKRGYMKESKKVEFLLHEKSEGGK